MHCFPSFFDKGSRAGQGRGAQAAGCGLGRACPPPLYPLQPLQIRGGSGKRRRKPHPVWVRFQQGQQGPGMPEEEGSGRRGAERAGMGPHQPGTREAKWLRAWGGGGGKQINRVHETIIIKRRVIKVKNGDCVTPKTNRK